MIIANKLNQHLYISNLLNLLNEILLPEMCCWTLLVIFEQNITSLSRVSSLAWLLQLEFKFLWSLILILIYSVVSIKRTGSLNYFEGFYHPDCFFHVLNENFLPPCSFFHVLNKNFAPPCSLITSCSLNRYYSSLILNLSKMLIILRIHSGGKIWQNERHI